MHMYICIYVYEYVYIYIYKINGSLVQWNSNCG
jgi:hypothetical protein